MNRDRGPSHIQSARPCNYCQDDAEFSREIGDYMRAEMYEESADRGDCVHRSPMLCREIEEEMPKALRLHADPPGRRPRGPSHLTLPSEDFDQRTGEPTGRWILPSWPAFRDNFAREGLEIPSSTYGSSNDGPSHRGPSHQGPSRHRTNHHESSSSRSFSMLPQDFGRSQGEGGVGGRSRMGSMGHSHESHHHGASVYGGSSLGGRDTNSDRGTLHPFEPGSLSSHGSGGSRCTGARSGVGGRRGSGSWQYTERPGMGRRQDSGTW